MYTSSEDAMEANEAISFEAARRELSRHGFSSQRPTSAAFAGYIFGEMTFSDGRSEWEPIQLTTRAVLEWLGY